MTNNQLTRERIELIANFHRAMTLPPSHAEIEELARIALAAMDSEPVAYMTYKGYLLHAGDPKLAEYSEPMPLYADPRPASTPAAPVAWDYEWASCITCEGSQDFKRIIEREAPPEWAIEEGQARKIIPLYRHAQPAPVVTFYRDGIEAAASYLDQQREAYDSEHGWSDPDTGSFEFGSEIKREYSSTLEELAEGIRALHPNAGNSPAIPDGYVMVPKEPTEAMLAAAKEWTGLTSTAEAVYIKMLEAAPQPQNAPQNIPEIIPQWIPVSERLPEDDDFVYIWPRPDFGVDLHVGQYCECSPKGEGWYAQIYEQNYGVDWHPITVTHWMPLPAAPQEVK